MRYTREHIERVPLLARQASSLKEVLHRPKSVPIIDGMPRVIITGDVRLRVTESFAALRPVMGHYRIETEGIEEPFHIIWISEGQVHSHTVHSIDVAFDMRGMSAGETLTQMLTAQVTERNGQGCIVHSSVFIQISVVSDDLLYSRSF